MYSLLKTAIRTHKKSGEGAFVIKLLRQQCMLHVIQLHQYYRNNTYEKNSTVGYCVDYTYKKHLQQVKVRH